MAYAFRGTLVINGHCEFPCVEWENTPQRAVEIIGDHCKKCIAELMRIAPRCAFQIKDLRSQAVRR
jgi:hypothetical protein